jgi:hypothetical protein
VTARQVAYRADGSHTDITADINVLCDSLLHSREWAGGLLPAQAVLAVTRLVRACGFELDEGTTRSAMTMTGIDPGPVWDRPLHPESERRPIRPGARIRFEAMLQSAEGDRRCR